MLVVVADSETRKPVLLLLLPTQRQHQRCKYSARMESLSSEIPSEIPSEIVSPHYFTPGILSGLIVSLLLIAILVTAISWMLSLDISYGSFEKKVDSKKTK